VPVVCSKCRRRCRRGRRRHVHHRHPVVVRGTAITQQYVGVAKRDKWILLMSDNDTRVYVLYSRGSEKDLGKTTLKYVV